MVTSDRESLMFDFFREWGWGVGWGGGGAGGQSVIYMEGLVRKEKKRLGDQIIVICVHIIVLCGPEQLRCKFSACNGEGERERGVTMMSVLY